jgi:hypothetical protein
MGSVTVAAFVALVCLVEEARDEPVSLIQYARSLVDRSWRPLVVGCTKIPAVAVEFANMYLMVVR